MADQFKKFLPSKKQGESDACTECGHSHAEHKVYPGGKCGLCHDTKKGFLCSGFNLGDTVQYEDIDDPMTGKPWKKTYVPGRHLKNGASPQDRL